MAVFVIFYVYSKTIVLQYGDKSVDMKTSAEDEEILPVILISHKSKFFL
jgi:hypothetical protein